MRLSRRKLLIAAPLVLGAKRASAFIRGKGTQAAPADPIAQLLDTMVSGQWKELTVIGSSFGGITVPPQQALTLAEWDYGVGHGGTATTWGTPPPSLPSSNAHGIFAFSGSAIRSDGEVNHYGGGHTDGGDNAVLRFSSSAACKTLLGLGGSQAWSLLVPGGYYIPQAQVQPAGSTQTLSSHNALLTTGTYNANSNTITNVPTLTTAGGSTAGVGWQVGGPDIPATASMFVSAVSGTGPFTLTISGGTTLRSGTNQPIGLSTNVFWATTNKNNQLRTIATHSYWYSTALGLTGKWLVCGGGAWSPNFDISPGASQEIVGDDGSSFMAAGVTGNTNNGYAVSGIPLWCDLDSNVYVWQTNFPSPKSGLIRITNPTTSTPTATSLGNFGIGTNDATQIESAVLIKDPNDLTRRAIFAWEKSTSTSRFDLLHDITGTPSFETKTFGSTPAIPGTNQAFGYCYDSFRNRIVQWNGEGQLGFIDPVARTWVVEPLGGISGGSSIPSSPAVTMVRIAYLPVQDAYIGSFLGHVWLRKP